MLHETEAGEVVHFERRLSSMSDDNVCRVGSRISYRQDRVDVLRSEAKWLSPYAFGTSTARLLFGRRGFMQHCTSGFNVLSRSWACRLTFMGGSNLAVGHDGDRVLPREKVVENSIFDNGFLHHRRMFSFNNL